MEYQTELLLCENSFLWSSTVLLSLRVPKLEFVQYCCGITSPKLCHAMMDKGRQVVISTEKELSLHVTVMK